MDLLPDSALQNGSFGYFVVRVHWPGQGLGEGMAGVVERLGSGEKLEFGSALELARFICDSPGSPIGGLND